jgi:flagellar motility protein MotE (MotC chaperone)
MSDLALLIPIAAITVGPAVWAFNNWTRVKHGFEPESWRSRKERRGSTPSADAIEDSRKVHLLVQENEKLNGQVGRLEERIRVLERIATDPAERTAREIDALR